MAWMRKVARNYIGQKRKHYKWLEKATMLVMPCYGGMQASY